MVSAGGTREPLDPVRFLGNRSSGRQGVALARAAHARGARVTLVAANIDVPAPPGVDVVRAETGAELRDAVRAAAKDADVVVMAAAVADYRPRTSAETKIKKTHDGAPTGARAGRDGRHPGRARAPTGCAPARSSSASRPRPATTTGSVLEHGRAKALRKGADLLVVNAVGGGRGFGTDANDVTILDGTGAVVAEASGSKDEVARRRLGRRRRPRLRSSTSRRARPLRCPP